MGVWTGTSYFPRELLQLVNLSKSLSAETPYYGLFRPNLTILGKVEQLLWKKEYHKITCKETFFSWSCYTFLNIKCLWSLFFCFVEKYNDTWTGRSSARWEMGETTWAGGYSLNFRNNMSGVHERLRCPDTPVLMGIWAFQQSRVFIWVSYLPSEDLMWVNHLRTRRDDQLFAITTAKKPRGCSCCSLWNEQRLLTFQQRLRAFLDRED